MGLIGWPSRAPMALVVSLNVPPRNINSPSRPSGRLASIHSRANLLEMGLKERVSALPPSLRQRMPSSLGVARTGNGSRSGRSHLEASIGFDMVFMVLLVGGLCVPTS